MEKKKCSKCDEVKSVRDFSKDKKNKDGLYYQCKSCKKEYDIKRKKTLNIVIPKTKVCSKCGEEKSSKKFHKNKSSIYGLSSYCKACTKESNLKRKETLIPVIPKTKVCSKCDVEKPSEKFSEDKRSKDGLQSQCKSCVKVYRQEHKEEHNALNAKRRATKLELTPSWVDTKELNKLYTKAQKLTKETGILYVVDHIFPAQPNDLSYQGLHIPENLQVITAEENSRKNNKDPREFYDKDFSELYDKIVKIKKDEKKENLKKLIKILKNME